MLSDGVLITVGVVLTIATLMAYSAATTTIEENPFKKRDLLNEGMKLPVIWLYLDTSDVNSRSWADFMGRSSRAINLPFLNLCYETIVMKNKDHYRVEIIGGLSDLAGRLGGWGALPAGLQNPLASVGEAELTWIRAAVLRKYGGIFLHPATIALKPFGELPSDKVVFFGTDSWETYSGPAGTAAPGLRCVWSPKPEHPLFVKWEERTRSRLDRRGTGTQFRGDEKWDSRELAGEFRDAIQYVPFAELSRKSNGKRIELEDLMSAGQQGVLPFSVTQQSVFVPIPWPELKERRVYGWFLRMSEDQILDSDLVISDLFREARLLPSPSPDSFKGNA
jgi:hypothetical protein